MSLRLMETFGLCPLIMLIMIRRRGMWAGCDADMRGGGGGAGGAGGAAADRRGPGDDRVLSRNGETTGSRPGGRGGSGAAWPGARGGSAKHTIYQKFKLYVF